MSNALYNTGTVNLSADSSKIVFNDGIDGNVGTISITSGTTELNNTLANNTISVSYGATLKLGSNTQETTEYLGGFGDSANLTLNGNLDTADGVIRSYTISTLQGSGGTLTLDMNLTENTADTFESATDSASLSVGFSYINVLGDLPTSSGSVEVIKGLSNVTLGWYAIFSPENKIEFTQNATNSGYVDYVVTSSTYTLKDAVAYTGGNRQYIMSGDEIVTEDLGKMGGDGSTLTIVGDGKSSIIAKYKYVAGIYVNAGQTLNMSDIKDVRGFTNGVVENYGTLTIENVSFSDNFADRRSGGAIYNSDATATIAADFSLNCSYGDGGAIYNSDSNIVSITGTFTSNMALGAGGAVANHNENKIKNLSGIFTKKQRNGWRRRHRQPRRLCYLHA